MSLEAKDIEKHIEQIRDERREAANTAKRVGSTMMEIFKYVAASVETALADISNGYLSKEKDDVAKGLITFLKGIKIDDIFQFDKDGNIIAYTIASPEFSEKIKTGFAIAVVDTQTGKYKLCVDQIVAWAKATVGSLLVEGNSVFGGDLSSPKYQSGFLDGFGWRLWGEAVPNAAGKTEQRYTAELDNLIVRGTMRVYEMIISQLLGENDNRIFTGMLEVDHYDAESGKVYLDTKEGRMYNPFRKDDIIMVQQYNGAPSAANDHYVTKHYELIVTEVGSEGTGEDMLAWVKFRNFTSSMEGATPEKLIKKKDTFVRVDNLTDEDRKGIVSITTVGPKTPYMDIIYGLKTDPDSALKGRLGNLQGITHPSFGQLKGFGELLQNLYAVGDLVLRRTGENIDTKFQILTDIFSSNFTKTQYELTDDTNYLHNGQFLTAVGEETFIDGWTIDDSDDTAFWMDPVTNMPVMVNGHATAGGNHRVEIERSEGRQVLRVLNCGLTQKNALIDPPKTHKEYSKPTGQTSTKTDAKGNNAVELRKATDGAMEDVQDTLYVSLRIYALTSGQLTIGFTDCNDVEGKANDLAVRTIDVPYTGEWATINFNGKWNGTGDFVIRYTGECRIAFVAITDTALSNLSRTVSTSIEQIAEAIKLLGQNDDAIAGKFTSLGLVVDALNAQVDLFVNTTYPADKSAIDNRIKVNAAGISALSTKIDTANNNIKQLGVNIDAVNNRVDTFVNQTYPNDQKEIRRLISVNADGISINAKDIDSLNGKVSELGTDYDTLSKSVTTYVNDYTNGYNKLNSRLTTAEGQISAHNTKIGSLETEYSTLYTDFTKVQSRVTQIGVYYDDNGNPIGAKWTEAGILTTADGNVLYAGKGESSDNLLVGTGSGQLWTLEQDRETATLDFTVDEREFVVRNAFPIGDVSFSNSNSSSLAALCSPVAKTEKGKYYILSFSTLVSDESVSDFYVLIGSASSKDGAYTYSEGINYSSRDDDETAHTTMRMLRYRKLDDGIEKRYYIIFQATGKYTRFKFVNRSYRSQVTSSTVTNYSTQSGIPDNVTVSQDSGRVRVTRNYTGTKRSDGQYDITETVTTITATKGYFYAKKIQLEPAVNTDLADVVPSSYKEGQNTIESLIKQTVDSIELRASKIIFKGETIINDKFWVDTNGKVHMNEAYVSGTINANTGKIGGLNISENSLSAGADGYGVTVTPQHIYLQRYDNEASYNYTGKYIHMDAEADNMIDVQLNGGNMQKTYTGIKINGAPSEAYGNFVGLDIDSDIVGVYGERIAAKLHNGIVDGVRTQWYTLDSASGVTVENDCFKVGGEEALSGTVFYMLNTSPLTIHFPIDAPPNAHYTFIKVGNGNLTFKADRGAIRYGSGSKTEFNSASDYEILDFYAYDGNWYLDASNR